MHAYICREEFITASYKINSNDNINIIFKTDLKHQNSIGIDRLVLVLTKFRCWDVILKNIVGSHQIENSIHIFLTTFPLRGPGGGWRGKWILSKMLLAKRWGTERWVCLAHRRANIQKQKAIHTYCLWAWGEHRKACCGCRSNSANQCPTEAPSNGKTLKNNVCVLHRFDKGGSPFG